MHSARDELCVEGSHSGECAGASRAAVQAGRVAKAVARAVRYRTKAVAPQAVHVLQTVRMWLVAVVLGSVRAVVLAAPVAMYVHGMHGFHPCYAAQRNPRHVLPQKSPCEGAAALVVAPAVELVAAVVVAFAVDCGLPTQQRHSVATSAARQLALAPKDLQIRRSRYTSTVLQMRRSLHTSMGRRPKS